MSGLNAKTIFTLDAMTCLVMGAALAAASGRIANLLAMPAGLIFWAGVVLIPVAALMFVAATTANRAFGWIVILGNVGWVVASLAVATFVSSSVLGAVFVLIQAGIVGIFAWLEWNAIGRAEPAHA